MEEEEKKREREMIKVEMNLAYPAFFLPFSAHECPHRRVD